MKSRSFAGILSAVLFSAWMGVALASGFTLHSRDLPPEMGRVAMAQVYDNDGCHGRNISPSLAWSGAPAGARSFAITVFDPDARGGLGWWHWVVYDIAPSVKVITRGVGAQRTSSIADGARQARNDFGDLGYDGPCPPTGSVHRYVVTVYALGVRRLPAGGNSASAVVAAIRRSALDKAVRVVNYGR